MSLDMTRPRARSRRGRRKRRGASGAARVPGAPGAPGAELARRRPLMPAAKMGPQGGMRNLKSGPKAAAAGLLGLDEPMVARRRVCWD